jgi:hypothetical protein
LPGDDGPQSTEAAGVPGQLVTDHLVTSDSPQARSRSTSCLWTETAATSATPPTAAPRRHSDENAGRSSPPLAATNPGSTTPTALKPVGTSLMMAGQRRHRDD